RGAGRDGDAGGASLRLLVLAGHDHRIGGLDELLRSTQLVGHHRRLRGRVGAAGRAVAVVRTVDEGEDGGGTGGEGQGPADTSGEGGGTGSGPKQSGPAFRGGDGRKTYPPRVTEIPSPAARHPAT